MHAFISTANRYGQARQPFFFLIDFEQRKPLIFLESELDETQYRFALTASQHQNTPRAPIPSPVIAKIHADSAHQCAYFTAFAQVMKEIQFGNSYLLNLSTPTPITLNSDLLSIYCASQAKYKFWIKDHCVCFSPECFVRIVQNQIFSYPMKGTINASQPNAAEQLLASDKEQAEHHTIVDLIRNDLAQVAENITVTRFRYLDKIQTESGAIYQTSSEICGQLPENWQTNIGTILAKLLPAGSICGAPKEKTVQIIQQAEGAMRGYYTGVFGYFDGENLESAVAIRYIEQTDSGSIFRSGGGITFQSEAAEEYQEVIEKIYVPVPAV